MINKENYMGNISVTDDFLRAVVSRTVSNCFGVAGMQSSNFKEFVMNDIFKIKKDGIGVSVSTKDDELNVKLHISVTLGTNISAVVKSIKNKVRFAVTENVGITVRSVDIFVDGIRE